MDKTLKAASYSLLKKNKDGNEKIIVNLNLKSVIALAGCFIFQMSSVFNGMNPFGIAFYGAVFSKGSWLVNIAAASLGILLFHEGSPWVHMLSLCLITIALGILYDNKGRYKKAALVSLSFFALKLTEVLSSGFIIYDIFAAIVEAAMVFAATYVFKKAYPVLCRMSERQFVSSAQSACVSAFAAVLCMSLRQLGDIQGFSISGTLGILCVMVLALWGLRGSAPIFGIMLSGMYAISHGAADSSALCFAFGALGASLFSSYKKIGVVLGFFIANTMYSLCFATGEAVLGLIYDSAAAALLLFVIPMQSLSFVSALALGGTNNGLEGVESTNAKNQIKSRLVLVSEEISELSDIYKDSANTAVIGKDYLRTKFLEVTDSACRGCPNKKICFESKGSKGYAHMSQMLQTSFKKGRISVNMLPGDFAARCKRKDSFVEKFNSAAELIKTEKEWQSKINELRFLMSAQLNAISDSVKREADGFDFKLDIPLAQTLAEEFDKLAMYPKNITATKYKNGRLSISLTYRDKQLKGDFIKKNAELISDTLGISFSLVSKRHSGDKLILEFSPAYNYEISTGYSVVCKANETICGDSFSIIEGRGSKANIILSDGMGSGRAALKESRLSVGLLKKFLSLGIDSDSAIRLVNSSLLLGSTRDSFATIDLCTFDKIKGVVSITKLGAAPSFIKTKSKVEAIGGRALPAGILKDIEIEQTDFSLDGDALIVMMSDGVADLALKNKNQSDWIEKSLLAMNTQNPQLIASKLMERAMRLSGGSAGDDMTIIVISASGV